MKRGFRRVAMALLGAATLTFAVVASAAPASAGRPVAKQWHYQVIDCGTGGMAEGSLSFGLWRSDGPAEASLYVSGVDPYVGVQEGAALGTDTFSADLDMYRQADTPDGPVVATVTIAGTFAPVGPVEQVNVRERSGNRWATSTGTRQALAGQAEVTAATGALAGLLGRDLTCAGVVEDLYLTSTNPTITVFRNSGASAKCLLGDGFLALFTAGPDTYANVTLGIADPEEPPAVVAAGRYTVDGNSITGTLPVVQPPGDPRVATIDLTIGAVVGRGLDTNVQEDYTSRVTWAVRTLTGTVTLPGGQKVELPASCTYRTFHEVTRGIFPPLAVG